MYKVIPALTAAEVNECRAIAERAKFTDGRISNPHNPAKVNLQLQDDQAYEKSARLLHAALLRNEDFHRFALPATVAPPLLTRYESGMRCGAHTDMAFLQVGAMHLRSDLSSTIFLNDPGSYTGGALKIEIGDARLSFKLEPGMAVIYPSDTLHEVEEVTEGQRLVAITFIQSRIPDPFRRNLIYNLNEVAALEGLKMSHDGYTRLQWVQQQLFRYWGEKP